MYSPENQRKRLSEQEAVILAARLLDIQRRGLLAKRLVLDYFQEAKALVLNTASRAYYPTEIFLQFLCYETERNQRQSACEQTPKNVFYIDEILKLSPDSLILNIVRDPRDVLLSQKNRWRRRYFSEGNIPFKAAVRNWINYSPILTSRIWRSSVRAGDSYHHNTRVLTIRFEDILQYPHKTIRGVCDFVGISYEPGMMEIENRGSSNRSDHNEVAGIDKSKSEQWRKGGLNSTETYICQKISAQEMLQHGYDYERVKPSFFMLVFYHIFLPLQLSLVFIVNYRRFNRIFSSMKRRFSYPVEY